jgi:hypothetical protein
MHELVDGKRDDREGEIGHDAGERRCLRGADAPRNEPHGKLTREDAQPEP